MKIEPLSQSNAEEIANHWHYEGIYAFYDMQADPEDYEEILSPEARGNHYYQVLKNDELYGFFCLFPVDKDKQELGLGMKPEYCGKGQGKEFLQTILRFVEERNGDIYLFIKMEKELKWELQLSKELAEKIGMLCYLNL